MKTFDIGLWFVAGKIGSRWRIRSLAIAILLAFLLLNLSGSSEFFPVCRFSFRFKSCSRFVLYEELVKNLISMRIGIGALSL